MILDQEGGSHVLPRIPTKASINSFAIAHWFASFGYSLDFDGSLFWIFLIFENVFPYKWKYWNFLNVRWKDFVTVPVGEIYRNHRTIVRFVKFNSSRISKAMHDLHMASVEWHQTWRNIRITCMLLRLRFLPVLLGWIRRHRPHNEHSVPINGTTTNV